MTAPTEAEIRAYMESYPADNWTVDLEDLGDYPGQSSMPFEELIDGERVTNDDFHVYLEAHREALRALLPALNETLRPLVIEAQVRAAVRFFEHYPDAPLAKRPVTA
jgi:hypothetical protein